MFALFLYNSCNEKKEKEEEEYLRIKVLCNYVVYEIKQRIIYLLFFQLQSKPRTHTMKHDSAVYHLSLEWLVGSCGCDLTAR